MKFARSKRLLLAAVAAAGPLPLPFNDVVGWPSVLLYLALLALFVRRAARDEERWLGPLAMNLLAVAYLPLLLLDLSVFWRGQLLRPLVHLAMFVILVKLFALRREKDKWHVFIAAFFLTLAGIGTSVHPTMVLYVVAVLALHLFVLTRLASLHVLAEFDHGAPGGAAPGPPLGGFVTTATLLTLLAAVPIFILLPRIRSPYLVTGGAGTGTLIAATSFSDEIGLDVIGRLRTSRAVVMRFAVERPAGGGEPRFKAATYDRFSDARWRRTPGVAANLRGMRDGHFQLAEGRVAGRLTVSLNPLGSPELPLPVEAVAVQLFTPGLRVSDGGAVSMFSSPRGLTGYAVDLAAEPVPLATAPPADGSLVGQVGVPAAVAELARSVAGVGDAAGRAARIERHLISEYEYTLDFLGRGGVAPIRDFLFENRRGHCELFATSMVLMLRAEGIPSRLVTGYLGAEYSPIEEQHIVRQSNRHAWVEAWIEGRGWTIFDPTPPAGRPISAAPDVLQLLGQTWDYLVFRWDRYVLTYGLGDQLDLFVGLRELWSALWESLRFGGEGGPEVAAPPEPEAPAAEAPAEEEPGAGWRELLATWSWLPGALLLAALLLWWWRRLPPTAADAWRRLRARAGRSGIEVDRATPPVELHRRLVERFPEAEEPGGRVLALYLGESFGGVELGAAERAVLADGVRRVERALRVRHPG